MKRGDENFNSNLKDFNMAIHSKNLLWNGRKSSSEITVWLSVDSCTRDENTQPFSIRKNVG